MYFLCQSEITYLYIPTGMLCVVTMDGCFSDLKFDCRSFYWSLYGVHSEAEARTDSSKGSAKGPWQMNERQESDDSMANLTYYGISCSVPLLSNSPPLKVQDAASFTENSFVRRVILSFIPSLIFLFYSACQTGGRLGALVSFSQVTYWHVCLPRVTQFLWLLLYAVCLYSGKTQSLLF